MHTFTDFDKHLSFYKHLSEIVLNQSYLLHSLCLRCFVDDINRFSHHTAHILFQNSSRAPGEYFIKR